MHVTSIHFTPTLFLNFRKSINVTTYYTMLSYNEIHQGHHHSALFKCIQKVLNILLNLYM